MSESDTNFDDLEEMDHLRGRLALVEERYVLKRGWTKTRGFPGPRSVMWTKTLDDGRVVMVDLENAIDIEIELGCNPEAVHKANLEAIDAANVLVGTTGTLSSAPSSMLAEGALKRLQAKWSEVVERVKAG